MPQRRWASEDATQSEPAADRETEAQHGDNSIAASSESQVPTSTSEHDSAEITGAAKEQESSLADSAKSAASAVADQASNAASQVAAAASSAVGSASSAASYSAEAAGSTNTKTVYVGNLFFDVKDDDLKKEFTKAGPIISSKIIHDQRGLSKGYD